MTRMIAIAASALLVVVLGVTWVLTRGAGDEEFAQCRGGAIAGGGGDIGGPFTLVDETGETVTDADVLSTPSLIYFGYTYCPDICPMDAARNADAVALLEERGMDVQPVFITIDPERDTPEVLAEFTDYLHPRMLGLTGSPEQVKAASDAYRTYFRKGEEDDGYYLMDHSTFTYLTLPGHGFVDFFRRDISAEQMADRVGCFVEEAGPFDGGQSQG
ncbi:protein SCO1/2 [Poseidonocella pacifica]|uniref:Protein SCO1/2 n=1 Tax=Poseidonocella pacifica TaxID=871651 RepID=A0A1I0XTV2_9RHOB|nr:SCO family protein [Poseidonocella pacifica]SFB04505.1 protein SCO1/2 [Poseidonocella pacifica]